MLLSKNKKIIFISFIIVALLAIIFLFQFVIEPKNTIPTVQNKFYIVVFLDNKSKTEVDTILATVGGALTICNSLNTCETNLMGDTFESLENIVQILKDAGLNVVRSQYTNPASS